MQKQVNKQSFILFSGLNKLIISLYIISVEKSLFKILLPTINVIRLLDLQINM